MEHSHGKFGFNEALGTQWNTWSSMEHVLKEQIIREGNESSDKGMYHLTNRSSKMGYGAPEKGMEHLGAWMCHIGKHVHRSKSLIRHLREDVPLMNPDAPSRRGCLTHEA